MWSNWRHTKAPQAVSWLMPNLTTEHGSDGIRGCFGGRKTVGKPSKQGANQQTQLSEGREWWETITYAPCFPAKNPQGININRQLSSFTSLGNRIPLTKEAARGLGIDIFKANWWCHIIWYSLSRTVQHQRQVGRRQRIVFPVRIDSWAWDRSEGPNERPPSGSTGQDYQQQRCYSLYQGMEDVKRQ